MPNTQKPKETWKLSGRQHRKAKRVMFFDGISKKRVVSSGGVSKVETSSTKAIVEKSRIQRQLREEERKRSQNATIIQRNFRGFNACRRLKIQCNQEFNNKIADLEKISTVFRLSKKIFKVPVEITLNLLRLVLTFSWQIKFGDIVTVRRLHHLLFNAVSTDRSHSSFTGASWLFLLRNFLKQELKLISHADYLRQMDDTFLEQFKVIADSLMMTGSEFPSNTELLLSTSGAICQCLQRIILSNRNLVNNNNNRREKGKSGGSDIDLVTKSETVATLLIQLLVSGINKSNELQASVHNSNSSSLGVSTTYPSTAACGGGGSIWTNLGYFILSLPDLSSVPTLRPLLQTLTENNLHGWHNVIRYCSIGVTGVGTQFSNPNFKENESIGLNGSLLSNICTLVLLDEKNGTITPHGLGILQSEIQSFQKQQELDSFLLNQLAAGLQSSALVSILQGSVFPRSSNTVSSSSNSNSGNEMNIAVSDVNGSSSFLEGFDSEEDESGADPSPSQKLELAAGTKKLEVRRDLFSLFLGLFICLCNLLNFVAC